MLLKKDPCEGCIISMLCEQMCPKVIKFYSARVRKRPKHEVEAATGYHWEDDYIDDKTGKVINIGGATWKFKKEELVKEKPKIEPVKIHTSVLMNLINFYRELKERN